MARFVQLESEGVESGKVSASSAIAFTNRTGYLRVMGPQGAGSLSLWLARRYDISFTTSFNALNAQGNLILADNEHLRLGIIHGLGLMVAGNSSSVDASGSITTGLLAQTSAQRSWALFGGVRYTLWWDVDHFTNLVVGWSWKNGTLHLGPELNLGMESLRSPPYLSASMNLGATF